MLTTRKINNVVDYTFKRKRMVFVKQVHVIKVSDGQVINLATKRSV